MTITIKSNKIITFALKPITTMENENKYHIKDSSYYWLNTWVLANIIQLGTPDFCNRFLSRDNDPCGRWYDQMTQAARTQKNVEQGAPQCPKCGKPMIKRVAKKGINSGHEFWNCSDYPHCMGTRSC